jgi:hypothetical protein
LNFGSFNIEYVYGVDGFVVEGEMKSSSYCAAAQTAVSKRNKLRCAESFSPGDVPLLQNEINNIGSVE